MTDTYVVIVENNLVRAIERAKIFASLCLEFTKALVEKRLAAINALAVGSAVYRADDERDANGATPRAG